MTTRNEPEKSRLAIKIEPELRRRIEAAAAARGVSVRDYAIAALREAVEHNQSRQPEDAGEWSRLSVPAFARDWESDADAVHDEAALLDRGLREAPELT